MMKINPCIPAYPHLDSGPTLKEKAVIDFVAALTSNPEWYKINGVKATVKEAIRLADEIFQ